jgi:RNA polymerase primary sigma factor
MARSSSESRSKAGKEHKAEVKLAEVEAQKKRLKTLIVLGKERGYLTYAEINDHLPDDMTDAEQIEGVVTMLATWASRSTTRPRTPSSC